ncbi:hypothetical protein A374_00355 [Fictibacillus macauensis ZFHKF-1]|uniref:Uncharacterized protein n=1 Tax=Fictibacillus macauensis ZFHKF-1 TaxID=1196324 RepID=I8ANI3_9BACL|nr:hypothetical protein [Fictibacillus macauensis]EIT87379.1 hypothetical protein A374_00355 [Fictibacillus macauensis ZFHKF-1]
MRTTWSLCSLAFVVINAVLFRIFMKEDLETTTAVFLLMIVSTLGIFSAILARTLTAVLLGVTLNGCFFIIGGLLVWSTQ